MKECGKIAYIKAKFAYIKVERGYLLAQVLKFLFHLKIPLGSEAALK